MFAVYMTCPCCGQLMQGGTFTQKENAERFVKAVQLLIDFGRPDIFGRPDVRFEIREVA